MKLKSYFSGTVEAAMELARRELGEEALLVNARPATPETRHLGAYETVFSVPVPHASGAADPPARVPALHAEACATSFQTDARLGAIVMLVGPPGVGKTTTLVKLAARYGLATRRRTHILSTDVYRIGAADQLRALASILGIGCDVVETPGALAQVLAEHAAKDLVLIDTAGLSGSEMEDGLELANFVSSDPAIDIHLVLSASTKPADNARQADAYAVFRPAKLLFTRLDETADYGALVSEAARCQLPISFLATGQKIPDDIEPATRRRLVALVEGRGVRTSAARSSGASV
jgi:flagellar biosynthesis protein FlhF